MGQVAENNPEENKEKDLSVENLELELLEKNPNIFDGIPEDRKAQILESFHGIVAVEVRQEFVQSRYNGPVPPPEMLREYQDIDPNFSKTLIKMAVDEQKHQHSRDSQIIKRSFDTKKRGQFFALIIALVAIVGGIVCIMFDHPISGSIITGVGLTGLVAEFLGQSRRNKNEDGTDGKEAS